MATFTKVYAFSEDLGKAVHQFGTHQLKLALTNTAPTTATALYANITSPLGTTNLSGGTPFNITTTSYAQTNGTSKLILADLVLTASGGSVGPFRYAVVYNDAPAGKNVIGWYDYGSSISLNDTETFTVDFDGTNGLLSVA